MQSSPPIDFTKISGRNSARRVVVAMSGGVDSSVAAAVLAQQGEDLVGISMQVWDYREKGGSASRATCCAPSDFCDARMVASNLGIPFYVFDFERVFREEVINRFVASYQRGLTPNPCIDCNNKVKFKELRRRALSFGGTHIATGHYARIEPVAGGFGLLRGNDERKDQSYFLYGLSQEELSNTLFPVGHLTKDEVRELARKTGLPTAEKPESQDICFVSGSVREFVQQQGVQVAPGKIVDRSGKLLGTHEGVHGFTVGQRKGLGVGGRAGAPEEPLYVVEIDPENQLVIVGPRADLERSSFGVAEMNWQCPTIRQQLSKESADQAEIEIRCHAQLRYRHRGVPVLVRIRPGEEQMAVVEFVEGWAAVSPGQAAVFYDGENQRVLGGGRMVRDQEADSVDRDLDQAARRGPKSLQVLDEGNREEAVCDL